MKRIAILFHQRESNPTNYVIHQLRRFWEEDGNEVVYLFGTRKFIPSDIVLLHVDLSVVPEEYLEFVQRYPIALNSQLRDIRKTAISNSLVVQGDSWTGPVIVKSNLNCFGSSERLLRRSKAEVWWPILLRLREGIERRFRPGGLPYPDAFDYKVYESISDVPKHFFNSTQIVVEKFSPEIENGLYHLRMAQVLGNRVRCVRITSEHAIIKAHRSISSVDIDPDPAIAEWRKRYHLDYGKLDYVVSNGEAILLDVNKTTGSTNNYRDNKTLETARRYLAEGIYSYFS